MLGFRIPNLTRDLFAEGALSSAFVPIFYRVPQPAGQGRSRTARQPGGLGANLCGRRDLCSRHDLRAATGSSARTRLRGRPRQIRTGRFNDPHHVPVSAAGGAGGAGHGRPNASNRFGVPPLASTFFNIGSVGFGVVLESGWAPRSIWPALKGWRSASCWEACCKWCINCRACTVSDSDFKRRWIGPIRDCGASRN